MAGIAGLLLLGWILPFFTASNGFLSESFSMSDEAGDTWGLAVMGVLVGIGALEVWTQRRDDGAGYGTGVLLTWLPMALVMMAVVNEAQNEVSGSGFSSAASISWGIGGVVWMLALLGTIGLVVLVVVDEMRTADRVVLPSHFAVAFYIASGVWLLAWLLPQDGVDLADRLFGGPFLVDVAAMIWAVGMLVVPVVAAVRPTLGSLSAAAGLAMGWACYWATAEGSSTLVGGGGAMAGTDWMTAFALSVVGIVAPLAVVWRPGTPFVINVQDRWWPWLNLVLVPLFVLVGLAN